MSATFDPALPTARDRMRDQLDDRDVSGTVMAQDETYDGWLAYFGGDETQALRRMAMNFLVTYGNRVETFAAGGGVSFDWSDRRVTWERLIAEIDSRLGVGSGTVYVQRYYSGQPEFG